MGHSGREEVVVDATDADRGWRCRGCGERKKEAGTGRVTEGISSAFDEKASDRGDWVSEGEWEI